MYKPVDRREGRAGCCYCEVGTGLEMCRFGTGPDCTVQVWDRFGETLYLPLFEFIICEKEGVENRTNVWYNDVTKQLTDVH